MHMSSFLVQSVVAISLQRGNECPGYDTKQSDGEAPASEI